MTAGLSVARPIWSYLKKRSKRAGAALRPKPVAGADLSPRVTVMSSSEVTQIYLEMRQKAMKTFANSKRPAGVSFMDTFIPISRKWKRNTDSMRHTTSA